MEPMTRESAPAAAAHMPRRFVSISRTDWTAEESDGYSLDAIADDGTAWWKHSYQAQWTQHMPLPERPL